MLKRVMSDFITMRPRQVAAIVIALFIFAAIGAVWLVPAGGPAKIAMWLNPSTIPLVR